MIKKLCFYKKNYSIRKFHLLLFFVLTLVGCSPSLLFTVDQFPEVKSKTTIPNKWHGSWKTSDSVSSCLISHDTISIDGFDYKINLSNLNLGIDSLNGLDKLIFEDDWCFLSFYKTIDSITEISGYQLFIGHIDKKRSILCWQVSYDYFLKHGLIDKIPAVKLEYNNLKNDGSIKKMEPTFTYIDLPKENKFLYHRIIHGLAFVPNIYPAICGKSFDFNFYKKFALNRTPDIILTENKLMIKRKKNQIEKKHERILKRNMNRNLLNRIRLDF
jgi:hypothetical protein